VGRPEDETNAAFFDVAQCLIDGVPDSWTAAELQAVALGGGEGMELECQIANLNSPGERTEPSAELVEAARALYRAFEKHAQPWARFTLRARVNDEGKWETEADFQRAGEGDEGMDKGGEEPEASGMVAASGLSPKLHELLTRHAALGYEKQCAMAQAFGEGCRWQFDVNTGTLRLSSGHELPTQVLAIESRASNTWTWGWASRESGMSAELFRAAERLHQFGDEQGVPELVQPELSLDQVRSDHLAVVACGLFQADGFFRLDYEGGAVWLLVSAPELRDRADSSVAHVTRVFLEMLQATEGLGLGHGDALLSYLSQKGYECHEEEGGLQATAPDGEPLVAKFDAQGRLRSLSPEAR
jgi:hypothetical protein